MKKANVSDLASLAMASAGAQLRTRTILDPAPLPRSDMLIAQDAFVGGPNAEQKVLTQWKSAHGGQAVCVYGSRAQGQADLELPWDVSVLLEYRRGEVRRREVFPWPCAGWVRRLTAEEILVTAVPAARFATAPFATSGYRLGAAVQVGGVSSDQLVFMLSDPAVRQSPVSLAVPGGCTAFRASSGFGTGGIQIGSSAASGAFVASAGFPTYPMASLVDWAPWSAFASQVRFVAGAMDAVCSVEFLL